MKFISLTLGVLLGCFVTTANGGAQVLFTGSPAVLQLKIEIEKEEVVASVVLVHREDGPRGVMLYFLTSEDLLHPASVAPPAWESGEEENGGDDTTLNIAVLRILVEKTALLPAAVVLDPPREGASFFIVSYTAAGEPFVVWQHAHKIAARSAMGDLEMPGEAGCVGAPAFTEKGVFGIVSECRSGEPPIITLLSAARGVLRRIIPGLNLGHEGSQTTGMAAHLMPKVFVVSATS